MIKLFTVLYVLLILGITVTMLNINEDKFYFLDTGNNLKSINFSKSLPSDVKHTAVHIVQHHSSSKTNTSGTVVQKSSKTKNKPKVTSEFSLNGSNDFFSVTYGGYSIIGSGSYVSINFRLKNLTNVTINLRIRYNFEYNNSNQVRLINLVMQPNSNSIQELNLRTTHPDEPTEKTFKATISITSNNRSLDVNLVYPNFAKYLNT